ncbi:BQ5605_C003g02342 [Microbotryum silenes-dioicae]|uniref:BQ5605_C003g02342 protein n=1 Tax=Microbotryum silenes-dioicae TaxID=796604 RepID=A0A2X0M5P3_9BASI|nr:BQ5605_C003g02342 [Microbotryum silenes-dioicae]
MSTSQPEPTPAAPQTSRREEDEDEVDLNDDGADEIDEAEIEAMKKRVAEMEAEAAKLRAMTAAATAAAAAASSNGGSSSNAGGDIAMSDDEKEAVDSRSIYVGNVEDRVEVVDYGSTPEEIQAHFASCGTINRVTILCDKYTGPKGYAYVEFAEPSLVANAVLLNESMFRGRLLKVRLTAVSCASKIDRD